MYACMLFMLQLEAMESAHIPHIHLHWFTCSVFYGEMAGMLSNGARTLHVFAFYFK